MSRHFPISIHTRVNLKLRTRAYGTTPTVSSVKQTISPRIGYQRSEPMICTCCPVSGAARACSRSACRSSCNSAGRIPYPLRPSGHPLPSLPKKYSRVMLLALQLSISMTQLVVYLVAVGGRPLQKQKILPDHLLHFVAGELAERRRGVHYRHIRGGSVHNAE
jgi:hypothetical protein